MKPKTTAPMMNAFLLERQLESARQEIDSLRRLTDYAIALIMAAGGRVEISHDKIEGWQNSPWRHEFDGRTHVFIAGAKAR